MSAYDRIARLYDPWSVSVVEDVEFYVGEAARSGGPVLELGVGTGRIAVPIAQAGIRIVGVDSSEGMLAVAREQADRRRIAEMGGQFPAQLTMDRNDVGAGGRAPRADGPDRLVGDDRGRCGGSTWQRAGKLPGYDCERLAPVALGLRFADADNGNQSGRMRRHRLGANQLVGFPMIRPTLGMAEDYIAAAEVGQHDGSDVAGMGSGTVGVTILPAKGNRASGEQVSHACQQARDTRALHSLGFSSCRRGLSNYPLPQWRGERGGGEGEKLT